MKQDYLQMRVLEVAPRVYATGQIFETDLELFARQGVRCIVNHRADNESAGQPASAVLEQAARARGINYVHFPVDTGALATEQLETFASLVPDLERPLVVFSRTGKRAIKLWEAAEDL